ncbi:hypothetical protein BDZ89DRAFT_1131274 [Hymenopellis radicata]|nr:hypothetical protein BDZ89DRAFT_1131274 [Hymenopellis radicata]
MGLPSNVSTRKYASGTDNADKPLEIDDRSQPALTKSFSALPKLEGDPDPTAHPSRFTKDLLRTVRLPARPEDMTEEFEVEVLEKQLRHLNNGSIDQSCPPSPTSHAPHLPFTTNTCSTDYPSLSSLFTRMIRCYKWCSL